MKEDTMTTHAPRPAAAAARTRAAPRRGGEDASRRLRRVAGRAVLGAAAVGALLGPSPTHADPQSELRSTIAFVSNRDHRPPFEGGLLNSAEIYLMDPHPDHPDPTKQNVRRLTNNVTGEFFPVLSPDGKKLVFESNRIAIAAGEPVNTSDLFVMDTDGGELSALTRGSSASWSPDGKRLAFHASALGTRPPGPGLPGVPTADSDIFVLNVDDCREVIRRTSQDPTSGNCRTAAPGLVRNLTNTPGEIEDDADWSPDGKRIVFTSRPVSGPPPANIYVINADGTDRRCLTCQPLYPVNSEEELAPDWSPDGTRIAFMCKPPGGPAEICVMNADGTNAVRLTDNIAPDLGPVWSPDGARIVFARSLGAPHPAGFHQLFDIACDVVKCGRDERQLTDVVGVHNTQASWGLLRVKAP
jgi:Tol biopolymer transport system component